jgi:hypothetical protein
MLAQNTYPISYINHARHEIGEQVVAYEEIVASSGADNRSSTALSAFEPRMVRHLLLALDGYFANRTRAVEKKDGGALNEVRWLCDAVMNHGAVLPKPPVTSMKPETTTSGLGAGDEVTLDAAQFALLAEAFFNEMEAKFGESDA